jgi:hypothetical protein
MENSGYRPRDAGHAPLHGIVAEYLETFPAFQRGRDRPIPGFVEEEFRSFLQCGILEYGFLRLHCEFRCGRTRSGLRGHIPNPGFVRRDT